MHSGQCDSRTATVNVMLSRCVGLTCSTMYPSESWTLTTVMSWGHAYPSFSGHIPIVLVCADDSLVWVMLECVVYRKISWLNNTNSRLCLRTESLEFRPLTYSSSIVDAIPLIAPKLRVLHLPRSFETITILDQVAIGFCYLRELTLNLAFNQSVVSILSKFAKELEVLHLNGNLSDNEIRELIVNLPQLQKLEVNYALSESLLQQAASLRPSLKLTTTATSTKVMKSCVHSTS